MLEAGLLGVGLFLVDCGSGLCYLPRCARFAFVEILFYQILCRICWCCNNQIILRMNFQLFLVNGWQEIDCCSIL
jgi:hypothetical protein